MGLSLFTASIEGNTKQEKINNVVEAMCSFADIDCDFNGENGPDYLWEEAKTGNYESNLEYTADMCRKADNPEEALLKFAEMWLGRDFYYKEYSCAIECVAKEDPEDETDVTTIAVAYYV